MLKRLNEEIKRRTHVVRIFPNGESCLRLVRALAVETHENWLEQRRYLNMDDLHEHKKGVLRARHDPVSSRPRPSLAPCSPPSRPLRAACGGGLRPVLTAAVRGGTLNLGRDEETTPGSNKETTLAARPFLQTQLGGAGVRGRQCGSRRPRVRRSLRCGGVQGACPPPGGCPAPKSTASHVGVAVESSQWLDCRRRALQPAPSSRPGECDDRGLSKPLRVEDRQPAAGESRPQRLSSALGSPAGTRADLTLLLAEQGAGGYRRV